MTEGRLERAAAGHLGLLGREARPWLALSAAIALGLTGAYWASGALWPTALPEYATSVRQITGMVLMLILTPTYLVAAGAIGQLRHLAFVDQIRSELPTPAAAEHARQRIRGGLRKTWHIGAPVGLLLGLLNTQPLAALESELPVMEGSISIGQLFLWCIVGLLLGTFSESARAYRELAQQVRFELFHQDRLRPLVRAGLTNVAIIAGALLFSPLQSLDAEFRWVNYRFALVVALPAAIFLLAWPLAPLHARLRSERARRLAELDAELEGAEPPAGGPEAHARLELLLAHRDRLRGVPTWPLDLQLVSRLMIYLVIPPLAWAGAALVERVVDRLIG